MTSWEYGFLWWLTIGNGTPRKTDIRIGVLQEESQSRLVALEETQTQPLGLMNMAGRDGWEVDNLVSGRLLLNHEVAPSWLTDLCGEHIAHDTKIYAYEARQLRRPLAH